METVYRDRENGITVRTGLKPGDLGYITYLHGALYSEEHGFDCTFEAYVAEPLSAFARSQDNPRQRIWVVEKDGRVAGGVAIVENSGSEAQLRWLLLDRCARGLGLGRRLVEWALGFCREQGYGSVFLWTVSELEAAAHIYMSHGFVLTEEVTHRVWGRELTEQRYDLSLTG